MKGYKIVVEKSRSAGKTTDYMTPGGAAFYSIFKLFWDNKVIRILIIAFTLIAVALSFKSGNGSIDVKKDNVEIIPAPQVAVPAKVVSPVENETAVSSAVSSVALDAVASSSAQGDLESKDGLIEVPPEMRAFVEKELANMPDNRELIPVKSLSAD